MKKTIVNIGKMFQGAVVVAGAVAVLGAGILCCCLTKPAEAAVVKASKTCGHCPKKDTEQKPVKKTCECCKVAPGDADHHKVTLDSVSSFVIYLAAVVEPAVYHPQTWTVRLVYTGPPRANMSLPIYLQQSSLRL